MFFYPDELTPRPSFPLSSLSYLLRFFFPINLQKQNKKQNKKKLSFIIHHHHHHPIPKAN